MDDVYAVYHPRQSMNAQARSQQPSVHQSARRPPSSGWQQHSQPTRSYEMVRQSAPQQAPMQQSYVHYPSIEEGMGSGRAPHPMSRSQVGGGGPSFDQPRKSHSRQQARAHSQSQAQAQAHAVPVVASTTAAPALVQKVQQPPKQASDGVTPILRCFCLALVATVVVVCVLAYTNVLDFASGGGGGDDKECYLPGTDLNSPVRSDGICGTRCTALGVACRCAKGQCCSRDGYCGPTVACDFSTSCKNTTEADMYCGSGSTGDWRTVSCEGDATPENPVLSPSPSPSPAPNTCFHDGAINLNGTIALGGSCGGPGQRCADGKCCSISGYCGPDDATNYDQYCGTGFFGQNLGDWRRQHCDADPFPAVKQGNVTEFSRWSVLVKSQVKLTSFAVPSQKTAMWGPQSFFAMYFTTVKQAAVEAFSISNEHFRLLMVTMDSTGSPTLEFAVECTDSETAINSTIARVTSDSTFKEALQSRGLEFTDLVRMGSISLVHAASASPSPSPSWNHCNVPTSPDYRCDGQNTGCAYGFCCMSTGYCSAAPPSGCPDDSIADYTMCTSQSASPSPTPSDETACARPDFCAEAIVPDGRCGSTVSGRCPDGTCCSESGWCGPDSSSNDYDSFCGSGSQGDYRLCKCSNLFALCSRPLSTLPSLYCGLWAPSVRCPDNKPCCGQGNQCVAVGSSGKCENASEDFSYCAALS